MQKVECFVIERLDSKSVAAKLVRGCGRWPQAGQLSLWGWWNSMEGPLCH